ncbi:MAG: 30S ribosomal protein S13 [Planctomycetes bacterium]|nr:30S ribosomal protein S13 [Planctomycetota bacterium]
MPRILGVDLPNEKRAHVALTYLYGVGPALAKRILGELGIRHDVRAKDLSDDEIAKLASHIEKNYAVEGALRRQLMQNISRLKDIGCYRGLRHRRGLPVRGQRTRSNARTRKGPRKTVAGKKQAPKK